MGNFPEWNMKYRNFRCRVIITDGRIFYKRKFRKNAKIPSSRSLLSRFFRQFYNFV